MLQTMLMEETINRISQGNLIGLEVRISLEGANEIDRELSKPCIPQRFQLIGWSVKPKLRQAVALIDARLLGQRPNLRRQRGHVSNLGWEEFTWRVQRF